MFPLVGESSTRRHGFRLMALPFKMKTRSNFSSPRVVSRRNCLRQRAVEAGPFNILKAELDMLLMYQGSKIELNSQSGQP